MSISSLNENLYILATLILLSHFSDKPHAAQNGYLNDDILCMVIDEAISKKGEQCDGALRGNTLGCYVPCKFTINASPRVHHLAFTKYPDDV